MNVSNESKVTAKAMSGTKELAAKALAVLTSRRITPQDVFLKILMMSFFAKALKSYQAIDTLWSRGFSEDALILSRTLFETTIQMLYVARNQELSVEELIRSRNREIVACKILFNDRDAFPAMLALMEQDKGVEDVAALKRRLNLTFISACPEVAQDRVDWVNRELDGISREIDFFAKGWWGHNIRWLAEQVGFAHYYRTFYVLQSLLAHSHPASLEFYHRESRGGVEFLTGPNVLQAEQDFAFIPLLVTRLLLSSTEALNNAFDLNLGKEITEVKSVLSELAKSVLPPGMTGVDHCS